MMERLISGVLATFMWVSGVVSAAEEGSLEGQTVSTWLVLSGPGPSWIDGKPVNEQGLVGHFHWLLDLYSRGTMRMAGPFTDDSGGMVVMEGAHAASVHTLLAGDPAIARGIMQYELPPLHPRERFLQEWNERRQGQPGDADGA